MATELCIWNRGRCLRPVDAGASLPLCPQHLRTVQWIRTRAEDEATSPSPLPRTSGESETVRRSA